jgi:hypothetical protein
MTNEYEWDDLKKRLHDQENERQYMLYDDEYAFLTLMKRIEELEEKLHYRIDTVHERVNNLRDNK